MASKCPNCGRVLKWYNVKAECPDCGVSIPNFNWEARLEEDNLRAEEKFGKFYRTLNLLKYSVFGTKLRIGRLAMSFIPALGFILPWACIESSNSSLYLDLLGLFTDGTKMLDFFGIFFKNIGGIFSGMSAEGFSGRLTYFTFGFIMMLLSVITIVLAFFMIFIKFKKPKTKAVWITDVISFVFAFVGAILFVSSTNLAANDFTIDELSFVNATSGALWGVLVYMALLFVAFLGNFLVSRSPIKSEDELENERLEKVRLKEEKEEADRIKKEAERAEAKKKAEAEQAEKVRKAKEALAKKGKK